MSNSFRPKYETAKTIYPDKKRIPLNRVINSKVNLYSDVSDGTNTKALKLAEHNLKEIEKQLPPELELPKQIAVVDLEKYFNKDAIGGYHNETSILFINSKYDSNYKIINYLKRVKGEFSSIDYHAPYLHELGHKYYYDSITRLAKKQKVSYNKAIIDDKIYDWVHKHNNNGEFLSDILSIYADKGYRLKKYTEIVAEALAVQYNPDKRKKAIAREILDLLKGDKNDSFI